MSTCPNCGETAPDTALDCTACGTPLLGQEGHDSGLEDEEVTEEPVRPGVTATVRRLFQTGGDQMVTGAQVEGVADLSALEGLFVAGESQVVVRPEVDITYVQAAQASYCPVCGGYHPQSELFLCPACQEEVGLEHRVEPLGICSRCAERTYEVALRFVPVPDTPGRYWLSAASNLSDPEWSDEVEFDLGRLPSDWEDRLTQIAHQEVIPERTLIEQVGRPLFQAVFEPEFWPVLEEPFGKRAEWQAVHFKLVDMPPDLACWPWEFLCRGDDFLALSRRTPVIRWIKRNGAATLGPESSPLRVLVVASRGADAGGSTSATEAALLSVGLEGTDVASLLEFEPLNVERPTAGGPPGLADALRRHLQSHFHVLHLAGEVELEFGPDDGPAILVLREGDTCDRLSLDTLGRWLEDSSVQVVVLGCCLIANGQAVSPFDPRLRVEDMLLRGNVVALVTFQFDLLPDQVRDFAQAFYSPLASRSRPAFPRPGLAQALAAGRKALLDPDTGAGTRAWAVPVLSARPVEGCFLDLEEVEGEEVEEEVPSYEPFVEESLAHLDPHEAPMWADKALEELRQHRVHLIVGEPDAGAFDLARQLARRLVDIGDCDLVLRFPRYESPAAFLPGLRNLAQTRERLAILYDTEKWERSTEELDDIVRLATARSAPLYVLIAVNVEAMPEADTEFGLWLQQNRSLWTPLSSNDYDPETLQRILTRILQEARQAGQLHPTTARTVLEYAEKGKLFGSGDLQIALPGQLVRFVYSQLVGQPAIPDVRHLRPVLQALSDAREELRRWFSERLDNSQRVLVMSLALFQGLPTHLFPVLYRQIVACLRRTFHLDLNALPVRAELRRWSLYLQEVHRRTDLAQETGFVEFASEMVETEILTLLRQDYSEWLLELVPLLGDLACGNAPSDGKLLAWSEVEQRAVQMAAVRALGEIGRSSRRAFGLVTADMERWLTAAWPNVPEHMERQVRAVPGHVLRNVAEAGDWQLETEIISTLARWRRHEHYKVRWAAVSACGRLAHVMPVKRLLPVYLAMVCEARESSHQTFQRVLRKTNDFRQAAAAPDYQAAVEVYQAATYALRMFRPDEFEPLRRVYDQAAGDGNLVVRINTAIALDRVATDRPDVACETILSWADPRNRTGTQKWACWWTAVAAATLLIEHERRPAGELRDLFARLLAMADLLTSKGTPRAIDRISSDIVWAMGACIGRKTGPLSGQTPLARTLALLGSLLGEDPWQNRIICAVFRRAAAADPRQRAGIVNATFEVMQDWLQPQDYQLSPARRQVAVEAYLNAGSARWNEASRLLRELAQFEAYDYGTLQGRAVETLDLEWLGVGGLMLRAILDGGESVFTNALPLLRTMASVKEPFVRSLAPFVLTAWAEVHPAPVMEALETWARGPQWTLQLSVAETALSLCLRGLGSSERLLDILANLTGTASPDVQTYLETHLGDLAEVDLPAATRLREAFGEIEAMEVR